MQIYDEDMQMVRDALAASPEFVKGHFENLLTQYETASARIDELKEDLEQSKDEYKADLDRELKEADEAHESDTAYLKDVLYEVHYWFDRVLIHKLPMTDPRKIARLVEDAL